MGTSEQRVPARYRRTRWRNRKRALRNAAGRLGRHRPRTRLGNQAGLTMIEVLVSVVVLAIVVAPAFDAMVRGRVLVAHRGEERSALRLIERKAEQLLAAGYNAAGSDADVQSLNMTAGNHPVNPVILLISRGDSDTSNDIYGDLTWTVTDLTYHDPVGVADDAAYKQVVIKLTWPHGAPRDSVVVRTIVG